MYSLIIKRKLRIHCSLSCFLKHIQKEGISSVFLFWDLCVIFVMVVLADALPADFVSVVGVICIVDCITVIGLMNTICKK